MINQHYFERYAYPKRFLNAPIDPNTFLSIVIPVFNETAVSATLHALNNCDLPQHKVEVILVINHSASADEQIKKQSELTIQEIENFKSTFLTNSQLIVHTIAALNLPAKKAGVGLARKIGMDEAAYRFNQIGVDGVIVCFDADSLCLPNYLQAIESYFKRHKNCIGVSIHFEHPVYNPDGSLNTPIILYELHLRYYIQALRFVGYPFAFHTIGSSMAVRSSVYQKQGGMNQRKAGEDFYFLHKIIPLGNFNHIATTKVIPSARISERVPFGTGRAMLEHQNQTKDLALSYDLESFKHIKEFLKNIENETFIVHVPSEIKGFLKENDLLSELEKIKTQSKNSAHFRDRFFEWFNGFKMLKLVHYLRDNYFPDQSLLIQSSALLKEIGQQQNSDLTDLELLEIYRKLDAGGC